MSKITGIIVDGVGDYASLGKRFRNGFKILKTDGPRGHTVDPQAIARNSRKQIGIMAAFRCRHVVVLTDFENRNEKFGEFVGRLRYAFKEAELPTRVTVVVANRMMENWYLADIAYLSKRKSFLRDGIRQKNFEGTHGKDEVKKRMKPGTSYSETKHGPQMFEILRFQVARKNSASFDEFLNAVLECDSD